MVPGCLTFFPFFFFFFSFLSFLLFFSSLHISYKVNGCLPVTCEKQISQTVWPLFCQSEWIQSVLAFFLLFLSCLGDTCCNMFVCLQCIVWNMEQAEPVNIINCHSDIWCNIPCLYVHSVLCGTGRPSEHWLSQWHLMQHSMFACSQCIGWNMEQAEPVNIDCLIDIWCNIPCLYVHSVSCGTWSRRNQSTSSTVTRTQSSPSHGTVRAASLPPPPKTRSCAPSIPEPAVWRQ